MTETIGRPCPMKDCCGYLNKIVLPMFDEEWTAVRCDKCGIVILHLRLKEVSRIESGNSQ